LRRKKRKYKPNRRINKNQQKLDKRKSWNSLLALLVCCVFGFLLWKVGLWSISSEYFNVKEIEMTGLKYVREPEVRSKIESALGRNIIRLDTNPYENQIEENSWIKKARVYKSLPGKINVVIEEKDLLALYHTGKELIVVDVEGNLVASPRLGEIYDLPLIRGIRDDDFYPALNFLLTAKTCCPVVYAGISELVADKRGLMTVLLSDKAKPVVIDKDNYKESVLKLWLLLNKPEMRFTDFSRFDIRFPGKIYFSG